MSSNQDKENRLTLDLLDAIEQKDDVSQRHLAQEMGVALGMANSYLKRCVKKGWIKVTTAPANRYLYYLTPTGFAEKARITGEFLTTSLALVKQSGESYSQFFSELAESGQTKIVFVGLSDLSEMAYLRALKAGLSVEGVFVPEIVVPEDSPPAQVLPSEWFGLDVKTELPESWLGAQFIFTSLEHSYLVSEVMNAQYPNCSLFIPDFLSLTPPELLSGAEH